MLLLYTDGITEARQGDTFFGEEGTAECMAHWSALSGRSLIPASLLDEVLLFSGGHLEDDAALLAVGMGKGRC